MAPLPPRSAGPPDLREQSSLYSKAIIFIMNGLIVGKSVKNSTDRKLTQRNSTDAIGNLPQNSVKYLYCTLVQYSIVPYLIFVTDKIFGE